MALVVAEGLEWPPASLRLICQRVDKLAARSGVPETPFFVQTQLAEFRLKTGLMACLLPGAERLAFDSTNRSRLITPIKGQGCKSVRGPTAQILSDYVLAFQ